MKLDTAYINVDLNVSFSSQDWSKRPIRQEGGIHQFGERRGQKDHERH